MDPTYSANGPAPLGLGEGVAPANVDMPTTDPGPDGVGITINDDGSVEIGAPDTTQEVDANGDKFNENLAERIDPGLLSSLANDLIEGVNADMTTRQGFIDNYNKGLDLLGLKIEEATTARTQKRNVSRVGHPLLLEACVRFQAQARAELLPAIGPCKVMTVGGASEDEDQTAYSFESDMNYFLTQVDKGFYLDMDRGLFALGFGGNVFKKAYHDPIKRIPMSRCIQIEDFIVSENASDLYDAQRKTHRLWMTKGELIKMMHVGAYRTVPINDGSFNSDSTKSKQGDIIGVSFQGQRTQDQEHEVWEIYTDIDPERLGLREKGAPKRLPLPYIVTLDKNSTEVYAIRRNWKKADPQYEERRRFVHYGLIPSFGFLCLGYLHLLGNQTRALRAIWRILIDAGMFSSFPGGLKAKGVRTDTNEIAPGPGEFVDVDIGPFDDIKSAFMLMPYKDVSPVFIQLSELIMQDSQRMGGIPEMEVGEGRTHIPVGTMMSLVEQATQTMASVHKRLHAAMQEELTLIKELFLEDPQALTRLSRNPARQWSVADEFADLNLVPASDPNIPSQTHRVQQSTALVALSQGPTTAMLYDQMAVQRRVLKSIGINDWPSLLHPPTPPQPQQDPAAQAKMAEMQLKGQQLQQDQQENQRKAAHELVETHQQAQESAAQRAFDAHELQVKQQMEREKQQTERLRFAHEFADQQVERQHEAALQEHSEAAQTHRDLTKAHMQAEAAKNRPKPAASKKADGGEVSGNRKIMIIRHGATSMNNDDASVDRIRGWKDIPLSDAGRAEAERLGSKLRSNPPDCLYASDLKRAHDTAKVISSKTGVKLHEASESFRPWNVGEFAGKTSKEAVPVLAHHADEEPDEPLPGGESFTSFQKRFFSGLLKALRESSGTVAIVTHHRDERLLEGWKAAGYPVSGHIDQRVFAKKGEPTGQVTEMEIPMGRLAKVVARLGRD